MGLWNKLGGLFGRSGAPEAELASDAFALELLARAGDRSQNLALSPASVDVAASMALEGARGRTAEQLASALHVRGAPSASAAGLAALRGRVARWNEESEGRALACKSGLFAAETVPLLPGFVSVLQAEYGARVEQLDFANGADASRERINAWIAEQTRGRVPEILGPRSVGAGTRLVLASALYFKARWAIELEPALTLPKPFTLASGERVSVPMMHGSAEHRAWIGPDVGVLELAYRGGDLAMLFVVPAERSSLAALEERLDARALRAWIGELEREPLRVEVPRFTVDRGALSLREPLVRLGVVDAFDGSVADFGGASSEPLALDDVVHRTYLAVTEEGTEAAAATSVIAEQSAGRRGARTFSVNRPFLFFLRDLREARTLFLGRVTDPRSL